MGYISKCGDAMMRTMLFEAAQVMLTRTTKWSWLKAWGMKVARHRGMKRAIVAYDRRRHERQPIAPHKQRLVAKYGQSANYTWSVGSNGEEYLNKICRTPTDCSQRSAASDCRLGAGLVRLLSATTIAFSASGPGRTGTP